MPDYADSTGGSPASDVWAAAPASGADEYDPIADGATNAGGIPGVPGLPLGSTGQAPTPAPLGPRAEPAPAPPGQPPGLAPPTPDAPPGLLGKAFGAVKDFFTGNTTVGDYKGGGAPKMSTDGSRDLDQTEGQKRQAADATANQGSTAPKPPSIFDGLF